MATKNLFTAKQLTILALISYLTPVGLPQTVRTPGPPDGLTQDDITRERVALIGELRSLEVDSRRFADPLAEAMAKAEIADAAWDLDRAWAKELLLAAFTLALPKPSLTEAEKRPGIKPIFPGPVERFRLKTRMRVLNVARRDKDLVKEMLCLEGERTGSQGRHFAAAGLADQSFMEGDVEATVDYIFQGIEADPTLGTAPDIITRIATRDRALRDRLILRYIAELRKFPLSSANQSDRRVFGILSMLLRPTLFAPPLIPEPVELPRPGPEVMRAYVIYMVEAVSLLEQKEPGYLRTIRGILVPLWPAVQQYAPELADTFMSLESRSRRPGVPAAPLPTAAGLEAERRADRERRVQRGLDADSPHEGSVRAAIAGGDFDKARRMIGKLADGPGKRQLIEDANAEEAVSLAARGNIYVAEDLAKELRRTSSISRVYPALVRQAIKMKDRPRAERLILRAVQQAKDSDAAPPLPPEGIPAAAVTPDGRLDPKLNFIAELATNTLPHSAELAFVVLDQLVSAANTPPAEARQQSWVTFDTAAFRLLAAKDEARTRQAAHALTNPVQRVLALAAVCRWKAQELSKPPAPRPD